jgi:hypothetical protein
MATDIPDYAAEPLRGFLAYWKESMRLLHLSMQGISMLRGMPTLVEVLGTIDSKRSTHGTVDDEMAGMAPFAEKFGTINSRQDAGDVDAEVTRKSDTTLSLERAKEDAAFAQKEFDTGFPLLHAHTLVGCWSALEAAIEDMVVGMLLNEPELLQTDSLARVRIPLAEFEALEKEERIRLLVSELGRGQGLGSKHGIDSFDALLERIGLSGSVDAETKQTAWEMHHVRNVIVHRNSLADRQLVKGCPWMGLKVGDKVVVTHQSLGRYGAALCSYVLAISYRLGTRYGVDVDARVRGVPQQPAG